MANSKFTGHLPIHAGNFEYFFNQAPTPFAILSGKEFLFTFTNRAYVELMNGRQLEGKTLFEAIPELIGQPFHELLEQVYRTGTAWHAPEIPATARFNGEEHESTRYFNLSYTPYLDAEGKTEGVLASGYDVTHQVLLRQREKEAERNHRAYDLFLQAPYPISIYKGEDFVIELVNEASLKSAGMDDSVIGKPLAEVLPEIEAQGFLEILRKVMRTGETYRAFEAPLLLTINGEEQLLYINFIYQPFFEPDGSISGVIATSSDVTAHVKARRKIEESEQRFRTVLEQAPDPILILKGEQMVLEVANDPLFRLWQIDSSAIGKPFLEILPEMASQGFMEMLLRVYHSGKAIYGYETPATFVRQHGEKETVYFDFVYQPYREPNGVVSGVLVLASTVTDKVIGRQQIEFEQERARLAIQAAGLGTFDVNVATGETNNSPRCDEIFGVEPGSNDRAYITRIHKDDQALRSEAFASAMSGGLLRYEARVLRDNGELRWIRVNGLVSFDESHQPLRIYGVVQDITDQRIFQEELGRQVAQRTNELNAANMMLQHTNSELEQYAHVSSHDLQEPLRKIMMFASMIRDSEMEKLSEPSRVRFDKIIEAANRMSKSLRDLLNFASMDKEDSFTMVDLNEVMRAVEIDLELLISQKNAVVRSSGLPVLTAIPLQMHQLMYNLVNNALKFSRNGVQPVVEISAAPLSEAGKARFREINPAREYVEMIVRDNGIGFDQHHAERIFTMFQRLNDRQKYSGTGIGLALCRKVVLNHRGDIYAQSTAGNGAAFHIALPS